MKHTAKKKKLEHTAMPLLTDADKKGKQAEEKQIFSLLSSSNAFRKSAKQMQDKDIPDQQKEIEKIRTKLQA